MDIPKHIAIIIDGNRRWAKKRGLPTLAGHKQGYQKIKQVGKWCLKRGVRILTVFAFSTENWSRSKREVSYLMRLLKNALTNELGEFQKQGIRLKIIGDIDKLWPDVRRTCVQAMEETKNNKKGLLNIAINYGGRDEITRAINRIIRQGVKKITEESFRKYLDMDLIPDPDLMIRTSGEQRLSNFLLWQLAYSELYFAPKMWPDFSEKDLDLAIKEFSKRKRRYGK